MSVMTSDFLVCEAPGCGKPHPEFKCSRCRRAYYCTVDCQRKHWLEHKVKCIDFEERGKALLKPELLPIPEPTNKSCGMCNKEPMEHPIILECGHGFCVACAIERCYSAFVASSNVCTFCPQGGLTMADFLDFYFDYTERFEHNAKIPFLSDHEKQEFCVRAVALQHALVDKFQAIKYRERASLGIVPLLLARALTQAAELQLIIGENEASMRDARRAMDGGKEVIMKNTFKLDFGLSDDEHLSVLKTLDQNKEDFSMKYFIAIGQYGPAIDEANRLVTLGNVSEAFGDWQAALEYYSLCLLVPTLSSDARLFAKVSFGMSRCQREIGNYDEAIQAASDGLKSDNWSPGSYKCLALAQQANGDLDLSRETMNRALFYEAPWDEDNKEANKKFLEELCEEQRLEEERRKREEEFLSIWGQVLNLAPTTEDSRHSLVSWESIKQQRFDMFVDEDDDEEDETLKEETVEKLVSAATSAVTAAEVDDSTSNSEDNSDVLVDENVIVDISGQRTLLEDAQPRFNRIKLTRDVLKWLKHCDPKYEEFFERRIKQLAAGDRSRILQKRLVGSKTTTIYETYLEQKSGFRILWTEDSSRGLIIWYVSPHDRVSRLMKKIDDAAQRSSRRQLTSAESVPEIREALSMEGDVDDLAADQVLLDPLGDVPLKLYLLRHDDIPRLASRTWQPPLYLTTEERRIVEKEGTVLLLGRSGTGKTICICNRIDYDRHLTEGDKTFSQLFIARSHRICHYVEGTVALKTIEDDEGTPLTSFWTFRKLVSTCQSRLLDSHPFKPENLVDYRRFKRDFSHADLGLDTLVIWTQIRSFIKGSIEAVKQGRPLTKEQYLDTDMIGSRRCRLSVDQRQKAYEAFERYEKYMKDSGLWDDCDRISAILALLVSDREAREELARRRVYVDEIQDYTQAEIALFFMLCDRGGLFFCGDPAQAVVEGVEFRFEEVRSVAYHLYPDDKRYIPEKPLTVNRNFRSHKGILDVAAQVLDKMFVAFPGSAKELPKDEGLFFGPRPGLFQNVGSAGLKDLVSKIEGAVLLTMNDHDVKRLEELVGEEIVVLSIRDSKGLEFPDIVLVDFFNNLPEEYQKPWRLLLQGKDEAFLQPGFPEIETHLKQLYTAITRCSRRFFFVETGFSDAGQAFARWLASEKKLVVKQDIIDVKEDRRKTADEWNSTGLQYAMNADSFIDDVTRAQFWLEKAVNCFKQGKDKELIDKGNTHLSSMMMRSELETVRDSQDMAQIEEESARMIEKLFAENLVLEARELLLSVVPLLPSSSQEQLQERLMSTLYE